MEENRENRPFLDKIYHQTGEFYRNYGSDSLAIAYYNRSLRTNTRDSYLKAKNYETLGDMYFDGSLYADAGEYYDSTMSSLALNSKPYRIIKRKRDNLNDVIYYEGIAKVNDSDDLALKISMALENYPKIDQLSIERFREETIYNEYTKILG